MSEHSGVFLWEYASRRMGDARLSDSIDVAYARRADTAWQAFVKVANADALARHSPMPRIEHEHWVWEEKVENTAGLLTYQTVGIEHAGDVQGLMQLRTAGQYSRLAGQTDRGVVYVVYLASAPWNVKPIVATPRYGGVGTILLGAAIQVSQELEFKGRVGLHSLPQSEEWYERKGMTCLGPDAEKRGLKYYEMTEAQAKKFLREERKP